MALLGTIRRFMWVAPVLLGIVFIAAGGYMISEGRSAKDEVRNALVAEQVTTASDAAIPGVAVDGVDTARAQEAAITAHTRGEWGPYSGLDRADPNRQTYVNGVSLRTALNLAVMGFKVSDLVVGLGVFMMVIGLSNILMLAPVMFWLRQPETAGEKAPARQPFTPGAHLPAPTG
ncbi:MAG: hypothetical protein Q7T33_10525 [Dehalococcoidia bacterium]|nr:hypothetical protein [Dehalococcoidia bacterium]